MNEVELNAQRYEKLRKWMSANNQHTWNKVCEVASIGCWGSLEDFDMAVDELEANPYEFAKKIAEKQRRQDEEQARRKQAEQAEAHRKAAVKPGRSLVAVIDEMLAVVPPEESDARARLADVRSSACYAAPEMMRFWWGVLSEALSIHICAVPLKHEWQLKVVAIFMNKSVEEAQQYVEAMTKEAESRA